MDLGPRTRRQKGPRTEGPDVVMLDGIWPNTRPNSKRQRTPLAKDVMRKEIVQPTIVPMEVVQPTIILLPEDSLLTIAGYLQTVDLVALSSACTASRTTLRAAVEMERLRIKGSLLEKLRTDEGALAAARELYAQGCALTDEEGVMLVYLLERAGVISRLTTIWLFSNKLGDATCRALARALTRCVGAVALRCLWLSNNNIGCAGVAALAESLAAGAVGGGLVELCLGENNIKSVGCDAIGKLLEMDRRERPVALPSLHVLVLEKNPLPPMERYALRRMAQLLNRVQNRRITFEL